jgi:hypothetical protein
MDDLVQNQAHKDDLVVGDERGARLDRRALTRLPAVLRALRAARGQRFARPKREGRVQGGPLIYNLK